MKFGYDFPGGFKSGEKATSGFVSKCAQISSKLVLLGNIVTSVCKRHLDPENNLICIVVQCELWGL